MTTRLHLMDLSVGKSIMDTHSLSLNGTKEALAKLGLTVISHTRVYNNNYLHHEAPFTLLIDSLVRANGVQPTFSYLNKLLVVVGYNHGYDQYVLMSSYDGIYLDTYLVEKE